MAALSTPVVAPDRVHGWVKVEDELLVDRLRAGDRWAFDLLYDRYFLRVYHFLEKRLRNRADAEETTQDVFVNVLGSIHSFRAEAPFASWIFGITRRTLAARFKRKRHPTVALEDMDADAADAATPATSGDPLESYELRERIERLEVAMCQDLSDEQRELVRLHHLQHRTIQEIATHLCKSEDAVKSNLYRARRLLLSR